MPAHSAATATDRTPGAPVDAGHGGAPHDAAGFSAAASRPMSSLRGDMVQTRRRAAAWAGPTTAQGGPELVFGRLGAFCAWGRRRDQGPAA